MCNILCIGVLNCPCSLLTSITLIIFLKDKICEEAAINNQHQVIDGRNLITDDLVNLPVEFLLELFDLVLLFVAPPVVELPLLFSLASHL